MVIDFKLNLAKFANEFHAFDIDVQNYFFSLSVTYGHGGLETVIFILTMANMTMMIEIELLGFVRCIGPRCQAYRCFHTE